ncbi:MAG: GNAT family N-acetyltransferase [Micropruina sp.]
MPIPDQAAVTRYAAEFEAATGWRADGVPYCFGDSPELANELVGLVLTGRKRATGCTLVEFQHEGEQVPQPGTHSVVYGGDGRPVCVLRTDEVCVGPLDEVLDPAFAWDEGEGNRTRDDWLEGHRAYWERNLPAIGAAYSLTMPVVLERFSVAWPVLAAPEPLATRDGLVVRPAWIDDRPWLAELVEERWHGTVALSGELIRPATMPALIATDETGRRLGALTFLPRQRPDGVHTELVTIDAVDPGSGAGGVLLDALVALARQESWRRVWLVTTNDNSRALRSYQRAGWDLVALRRDAMDDVRRIKPGVPAHGLDGIPLRHQLELEYPLHLPGHD